MVSCFLLEAEITSLPCQLPKTKIKSGLGETTGTQLTSFTHDYRGTVAGFVVPWVFVGIYKKKGIGLLGA